MDRFDQLRLRRSEAMFTSTTTSDPGVSCVARSVRRPKVDRYEVVPWTIDQVVAKADAMPDRYRIVVLLGAGLGLRQGEIFGLSPHDVDFLRGSVAVGRQVRLFQDGKQSFSLPKARKTREVPLPAVVRDELARYLAAHPPRSVTLPWGEPGGEDIAVPLVLTSRESKAIARTYFNSRVWNRACSGAASSA